MQDPDELADTKTVLDPEGGEGGGEDDSSTEKNGDDSHLHDDQKSRPMKT